ncbi:hypothetical protein BD410DRAFT_846539 [Rickenella mellea]|uniref:Uncharacterized protein n=1 Tax=Rickenella mellea TaxID=50990 RepID=A0A4Y7PGB4_9AGAM|nr:hypothetical protein BD410DRAFT_846539 [Rickenella mellea]
MAKHIRLNAPVPSTKYTPSGLNSLIDPANRSEGTVKAVARALLRRNAHKDNNHLALKAGGLHKEYIALIKDVSKPDIDQIAVRDDIIDGTWADVLDAITMLDRVDGGFTMAFRVPGVLPIGKDMPLDDLVVDVYLPPREIELHRKDLERSVAKIVQVFGQEIGVHHLKRFHTRCGQSGTFVPQQYIPPAVKEIPLRLIPAPVAFGSAHYKFRCRPMGALESHLTSMDDEEFDNNSMDWQAAADDLMAMEQTPMEQVPDEDDPFQRMGSQRKATSDSLIDDQASTKPATAGAVSKVAPTRKIIPGTELQPSPQFSPSMVSTVVPAPSPQGGIATFRITTGILPTSTAAARCNAIISIGPHTDAALDALRLSDRLIPYLHTLIQCVRNTSWEAVLESPDWGLKHGHAVTLAHALQQDVQKITKLKETVGFLMS